MAAFTIPGEQKSTRSTLKQLFNFLTDFKNFNAILPHDKIEDFKFSETECSFVIKGITPLTIKLAEKVPYEFIKFSSDGLSKFNFILNVYFSGDPESAGTCRIDLEGDLNPFIKSMAEKPLANLVNQMTLKLSELQLN